MEKGTSLDSNPYENTVLDVHYADWHQGITIVDPSTQKPLYTLRGSGCHVPYEITNGDNKLIGTAKISMMSSKIAVEMITQYDDKATFEVRNDKLLGMVGSPSYVSPAFDGQTMTWKNTAMSKSIIYTLIEGKGMALAKFKSDPKTQVGKLELVDPELGEAKMNEIMVLLLTLLKRKLKSIQQGNLAAIS